MSAGIVFYIGAALVFLLAACNTTDDVTTTESSSTVPPTPTAITVSSSVVTETVVDPVSLVEGNRSPAVVDVQIDAMDIVAAREEVLARIYEDSLPSVVFVRVVHRLDPDDRQFGGDFFGGIPVTALTSTNTVPARALSGMRRATSSPTGTWWRDRTA